MTYDINVSEPWWTLIKMKQKTIEGRLNKGGKNIGLSSESSGSRNIGVPVSIIFSVCLKLWYASSPVKVGVLNAKNNLIVKTKRKTNTTFLCTCFIIKFIINEFINLIKLSKSL